MSIVLGLDVGTNSVGWALIDDEAQTIIRMGVRIFQAGKNDVDTDKEESRNKQRRDARLRRRQLDRRRRRKAKLRYVLQDAGLLPKDMKELAALFLKLDQPYALRAKGIDHQLTIHEFGRVLYHLNQHRGFKSNRKAASDEEDSGTIFDGSQDGAKPGILVLRKALIVDGYRTIGEYFSRLDPHETRIRNRFTERSMYQAEFDVIWNAQREHYPELLTDELRKIVCEKTIFKQRPLKSSRHLVGKCTFFPLKSRAPRSHPLVQRFRLLQSVNGLRIRGGFRVDESQQLLTQQEREHFLAFLDQHENLDLTKPKQTSEAFGIKRSTFGDWQFNMESVKGCSTVMRMRKAVGADVFASWDEEKLHRIWHHLYDAEDRDWLKNYLESKFDLSSAQAESLSKVKLEPDYASLSLRAIRRLLPFMEEGMLYSEAAIAAGFHHSKPDTEGGRMEFVPVIDSEKVRNPVVQVSLSQVRKVVNALIREYGKPDRVHIEMARSLKLPKSKRDDIRKQNRENEKASESAREMIIKESGIDDPRRDDVLKYKLWVEAKHRCMYSGKMISAAQLFAPGVVEVDHIVPWSLSLDDSYMNKTICLRDENHIKGNKTPWQAFGGDTDRWEELKARTGSLPHGKSKRLLANDEQLEKIVGEDFLNRQLTDTAYIATLTKDYVREAIADVVPTNGSATAKLRRYWGLNRVLRMQDDDLDIKNREDHRHHAVDALVIALTTRSALQKLSAFHAREMREHGAEPLLELPWNDLVGQAAVAVHRIMVSHKPSRKVRGQMHKETVFGIARERFTGNPIRDSRQEYYTVRQPLASFTDTNKIYKIADPTIKEIVFRRLEQHGVPREKLTAEIKVPIPKLAFAEPLMLKSKTGRSFEIKSVRVLSASSNAHEINGDGAFVETGSNHHMAIFEHPNGKREDVVVALMHAYERMKSRIPVVDRDMLPNAKFLNSFTVNDAYIDLPRAELEAALKKNIVPAHLLYRVQTLSKGDLRLRRADVAKLRVEDRSGQEYEPGLFRIKSFKNLIGCKVHVDAIGNLRIADD